MAKKCPPGVICIENMTIIFFITIVGLIFSYYHYVIKIKPQPQQKTAPPQIIIQKEVINRPSYRSDSVLLNPFSPPSRDSGYFSHGMPNMGRRHRRGPRINIKTRGYNDSYRQIGLLTRMNGRETMLPLMGRPLHTNRNKWQFYTMSDKFNSLKLPISRNGRSCTNEYGCDDLNNGDSVFVEGYNDAFKVTIYDNNQSRYNPFM